MTRTDYGRELTSPSALVGLLELILLIVIFVYGGAFGVSSLHAQTIDSGTIQGQVSDATGAPIPGASIQIVQVETGVSSRVQTDNGGRYFVPSLRVGRYEIAISRQGFKTVLRTGLVLQVNQIMDVSVALQVGAVSQQVTVSGSAPLIQTTDATLGQVTENRQIVQLPLNGRSYAQLAFLSPTVVPVTDCCPSLFAPNFAVGGTCGASFSVGGARGEDSEFTVDGFNTVQDNTGGSFIFPSVDAIEEFKIVRNSYMPDMGSRIGQVMVVSKGGTNSIHGSAFEFLRNDALDARDSFALTKSPLRQNQFGATVGGPIIKDKTFWLFSYEGTRIRQGITNGTIVPDAAERMGDFSELLPGTQLIAPTAYPGAGLKAGDAIPGNRLDFVNAANPGAINPIALNVIRLTDYPLPNAPGNLYVQSPSMPTHQNYYQARIDHNISGKDRIWGSWFWEGFGNSTAAFTTNPKDRNLQNALGQLIGVHWTRILRSNLTNDLRVGYDYLKYQSPDPSDPSFTGVSDADLGFPDDKFQPLLGRQGPGAGIPNFNITGYGATGGIGFGGPYLYRFVHMELGDTLNYVRGHHSISFGARILRFHQDQRHAEQGRGQYNFSGQYSGDAFADFLLGFPNLDVREITLIPNTLQQEFYDHAMQYGFFAQDSWQISPRLTLAYGLRYDYFGPTAERLGRIANFIPRGDQIVRVEGVGGTGGSLSPSGTSLGTQGFDLNRDCLCTRPRLDFGPRIALAIRPSGASDRTVLRLGAGIFHAKTVENAIQSIQFNPPWILTDSSVNSTPVQLGGPGPTFNMTNGFPGLGAQSSGGYSFDPNQKDVTVQQWSFEAQRQLTENLMASVSYVGSEGYHLMENATLNEARPGPGPFQPRRPYPGAVLPQSDPFPVSPVFLSYVGGGFGANSNYHALTFLARKQFSQGLTFLSHFTWSKSIDDASAYLTSIQDPLNLSAERGLSSFNVGRRFVASWIYELPFGREKLFLGRASGVVNQLLGGWQTTGILGVNDGYPFSPTDPLNLANTDASGANRPNRVCNGRLSNHNRNLWFDPNCFPLEAPFHFGNAGRDVIIGPGAFTFDFSLMKDFRFKESQRIQFRLEMFNALNHTNLGAPFTAVGVPGVTGRIFSDQGGTTNSPGARQIQFGLKYVF
jgi:hypothetical protein